MSAHHGRVQLKQMFGVTFHFQSKTLKDNQCNQVDVKPKHLIEAMGYMD